MDGNGGGSSSSKRKRCDEEDGDEEWKMEKFFDLIQNLRESVRNPSGRVAMAENARKKRIENKGVWEPRFELQDFADPHNDLVDVAFNYNNTSSKPTPTPPRPASGLDLTLSL